MATKKSEIKTNIEANAQGFLDAINDVKKSISSCRTEFANINAIMKNNGGTTEQLTEHQKLLENEINLTKENLSKLGEGLEYATNKFGENSDEARYARQEYQKASTHLEKLKLNYDNVTKSLKEMPLKEISEKMENLSGKFKSVSDVADKFGNKIRWISAGAGSLLGIGAKTAIEYEDAFVGVTKTVEGTTEQLENIRKGIMGLSNKIPIATKELFALAEEAGQLGIKTEDVLTFTELMAKLGTATNLSAMEAGEAIATFVNVMGTLPENYERIGSVIVQLGNNSKATESDIVAMAQRMSGAGATLGMSESAVLGLATALSSVGLEAEMGGTAISRVMNDFNRAANGVETKYGTLAQYAKIAGMSTKEFADTVKNNAGEAVKQFVIGLGDTNRTGKSTIQLMSDLGINEVRLTDTMLRLANASGTVDEYMKMADEEWGNNTALTIEASKRYADTASQIDIAKNKLGELADKFGKLLLPTINSFLTEAGKVVTWLGNLDEGTQKTIVKALALTTALLPLSKGVKTVAKDFSDLTGFLGKHPKIIATVASGFTKLGGVLKVVGTGALGIIKSITVAIVSNPIGLAITTLIGVIVLLWTKCEWFRNLVIGAFNKIKEVCSNVFESIKQIFSNVWDSIVKVWEPVKNFFSETWNYIIDTLKPVMDSFVNIFVQAWELIKVVWDLVKPYFETIWQGISSVFSVVGEVLGSYFQVAWTYIKGVWNVAVQYFQLVWTGIKAVFSVVATVIGGAFQVAWSVIKTVWDTVTGYFKAIFDTIAGIFSVIKNVLTGNFSEAWEGIKKIVGTWTGWFKGIWDNIKNVFSKVGDFFKNTFSAGWNAIKSVFSGVGSFFSGIWSTIKSTFTNIAQTVGNAMSNAFKSAVNGMIGMAEKVLNTPIRAINTAIGILNKVPGVSISKLNTFTLPRMETGGVLDKGARTIIAGENGAEAIVPLEKNTQWINKVADQFKDSLGINTNYINQTDIPMYNEEYLANAVDLLERIYQKDTNMYLDGSKISQATASSDDTASGDLLEKYERGWAV